MIGNVMDVEEFRLAKYCSKQVRRSFDFNRGKCREV